MELCYTVGGTWKASSARVVLIWLGIFPFSETHEPGWVGPGQPHLTGGSIQYWLSPSGGFAGYQAAGQQGSCPKQWYHHPPSQRDTRMDVLNVWPQFHKSYLTLAKTPINPSLRFPEVLLSSASSAFLLVKVGTVLFYIALSACANPALCASSPFCGIWKALMWVTVCVSF